GGGRGKALSPDLMIEELREAEIEVRGFQRTVGLDRAGKLRGREQPVRHGFEALRESREILSAQREARCCGVPAEAQEQVRFALCDEIQRVAQMQAENGPARAADFTGTGDRKSTRLNSSHEWISYAVFCLKKKIQ